MAWMELTSDTGKKTAILMSSIITIVDHTTAREVMLSNGQSVMVSDTYDSINQILNPLNRPPVAAMSVLP